MIFYYKYAYMSKYMFNAPWTQTKYFNIPWIQAKYVGFEINTFKYV
jgi:hypothetical protein